MIIKFQKLSAFTGYFVFFFDFNTVHCCCMPDDDFYKRVGWVRDEKKAFIEIPADNDADVFNL